MAGGIVHSINGPFTTLAQGQAGWTADHTVPEGAVAGVVPIGAIVMWSGTIASVPTHWAFCDGTLNAPGPDLRNQFVVGAQQDSGGVAKTNIEGSLKVSATQTGATVADHTALTHDGAVASHPDLTHVALSHPALTVVHPDHSLASVSHTHASGADVSVPSGTFASNAAVSVPSGTFASHAAGSVPSSTAPSIANASAPSGTIASTAAVSVPSLASISGGVTITGTATRSVITTGGLLMTLLSSNLGGDMRSEPSAANASAPSGSVASTAAVSVPSHSHASAANASMPSGSIASTAAASGPSGSIASTNAASRPSATGSEPAVTATHADHSLASLSHQAIGTHANLSHAFTPPAAHGAAGTLTHSTVAIVPAYYALAFIQRMS